ncbi:hypothetical protein [Variovorax sp. CY25R-8]|uniref:hypothetical protein n=1 Tax=Variovorax sp. CY25R-8 TaxID=2855501 RepID=UPI0021BBB212|nr:hypothetical protein [Variovorax sp. CY25R-8]MCT8178120.1 hypothetical protein [Variovorax sp. CY25R-8]
MHFKGFETSFSLLQAYERLALEYKQKQKPHDPISEGGKVRLSQNYGNYRYSLALLNLNASIVEGALRSALSEKIWDEVEEQVKLGISQGRTSKGPMEILLFRFQMEVDGQGGWTKLKEQYALWANVEFDKQISPAPREAVEVLFVLRNVLAHGGALLHPTEAVPDDVKDDAVAAWYRKLQRARVYLEKVFGHDDVFKNLSEYSVPEHFLEQSKLYLKEVQPLAQITPFRGKQTWDGLMDYHFGYSSL